MRRSIVPLLAIGSLLQFSAAIPKAQITNDPNYASNARAQNSMQCLFFDPPDHDATLAQCKDVCGEAAAKAIEAGKGFSISCLHHGETKWEEYGPGKRAAQGKCLCDHAFINFFAETFIEGLPAIAEIGCNLLMTTVTMVAGAASMIPGVGQAIGGGLIAAIEAAKLAAYAFEDGQEAADEFEKWLNPCGTSNLPDDMKNVFETLNNVPVGVLPRGFKPPKNLPRGGGKSGDKPGSKTDSPDQPQTTNKPEQTSDPNASQTTDKPDETSDPNASQTTNKPEETSDPNSSQTTDKSETTTDTNTSQTTNPPEATTDPNASQTTTKTEETSDPNASQTTNKPDDEHVTEITKSEPEIKTITKTCSGSRYPQACYHYYSAINNYDWVKSVYTCSDSNARAEATQLTATHEWKKQHANKDWHSYTKSSYTFNNQEKPVTCQADEFPPAYFMPLPDPQHAHGQLIRWLPSGENSGAANTEWGNFCAKEDGGKENGQRHKTGQNAGKINTELVSMPSSGKEKTTKGGNGKMTTVTEFEVKFTRAVFEMQFDKLWPEMPSKENDWGLRQNPCWPEDILPDDPGYVLLTDDNWYKTAMPPKDHRADYAKPPPKEMIEAAEGRRGTKRPHSPDEPDPNKRPEGEQQAKRGLALGEDGLGIRDGGAVRKLTRREMEEDIEVIQCADRLCSKERRALGDGQEADGSVIVIPGTAPATMPSENVDAIPTRLPVPTTLKTTVDKRSIISPDLPAVTVTVA